MTTKTYTYGECYAALHVDAKTFRRWLAKAGIQQNQISRLDERVKFLTEDQLRMLAEQHGRPWPPATRPVVTPSMPGQVKLALDRIDDRLAGLSTEYAKLAHVVSQHDEELASQFHQLEEQSRLLADALVRINQAQATIADQAAQIASLIEQFQAASRPRAARRQRSASQAGESGETADQAGPPELPPDLVGAAEFAEAHGINVGTAKSAYQSGRIPTRRGKWRGPGRNPITVALDAEGRARFHELYAGHRDFVRACQDCQAGSPPQV
jgi:hypothetical protein